MLTESQIKHFHENGYLILENYFNEPEIDIIKNEVERISNMPSPGRILEKDNTVRSVLGPHLISRMFHTMINLDRFVIPAQQLLDSDDLYVHQVKINHKRALSGERWDWHQDLLYWNRMDGFPGTGAVSIGLFLDDVGHENGPLMLIPGSHKEGIIELPVHEKYDEVAWESNFSSDLTFKVGPEKLAELVANSSVQSAVGKRGLAVFFHDSIFHGSGCNMSATDRTSVYFTYNKVSNAPPKLENPRPVFASSQEFDPIKEVVSSIG